tara:strand:- start:561 stop:983 length:423 start_codon:yes stop_codon:yes gene_type:complete
MDSKSREQQRNEEIDYSSVEEIMHRRLRALRCVVCNSYETESCACVNRYIYKDTSGSFRIKRDNKSTLPHGVITAVEGFGFKYVGILAGHMGDEEEFVWLENVVDINPFILGELAIGEEEKKRLVDYWSALFHASESEEL